MRDVILKKGPARAFIAARCEPVVVLGVIMDAHDRVDHSAHV